jgi:hypothetical protein
LNAGEFVPSGNAEAIPFDGSKRTPRLNLRTNVYENEISIGELGQTRIHRKSRIQLLCVRKIPRLHRITERTERERVPQGLSTGVSQMIKNETD